MSEEQKVEEKKEVSTEEAKAILEKDRIERQSRCIEKIKQALNEENCEFQPNISILAK